MDAIAEDIQTFSHQHSGGEVYTADNLEIARDMCPVLGKMSLEEVGLLLELETIGNELLASEPDEHTSENLAVETSGQEHQLSNPGELPTNESTAIIGLKEIVDEYNTAVETQMLAVDIMTKVADSLVAEADAPLAAPKASVAEMILLETSDDAVKILPQAAESIVSTARYTETRSRAPLGEADTVNVSVDTGDQVDSSPRPEQTYQHEDLPVTSGATESESHSTAEVSLSDEEQPFSFFDVEDGSPQLISLGTETVPEVSIAELPAPLEEISSVMSRMIEVEQNETDTSIEVQKIIETIISLPQIEGSMAEGSTKEVEEKLEKLFTELFVTLEIEHTPELIRSFVILTRLHYLDELLLVPNDKDDNLLPVPREVGTHEFLQKLLHGLGSMKRAFLHFYEIGRSAMRLYSLNVQSLPSTV